MRIQLLREGISHVHAIAYTHSHADHLFGLDDARLFPKAIGGPVPIYCEDVIEADIRRVFHYAFSDIARKIPQGGVPQIRFERIEPGVPFRAIDQTFLPIRLHHGRFEVLGFRIGNLAYCTDVNRIPESSLAQLESLDILILDALRHEWHPTHFSLGEALETIQRLQPKQAYLTHLSHSFDHGSTEATLPPNVALAYDGLTLDF